MEGEIGAASTPLGSHVLPLPRNQHARPQTLRQKPLFGETPTNMDGDGTDLGTVSIPDLQPREQGISDTPIREREQYHQDSHTWRLYMKKGSF